VSRRYLALTPLAMLPALAFSDPPHEAEPADVRAPAALVLSGDVDYLRVKRAAEMHLQGRVGVLLLTGAGVGGDSAAGLAVQAQKRGVPREAIVLEERSTTTRENLVGAAAIVRARGWTSVALVTSASHMGRALRVARRAVPEVRWIPVPVPDAGPSARIRKTRLQEWAKLAWYGIRGWI
jgi:uncharacterized SAM-binding protein YcdF (DUF218 family)